MANNVVGPWEVDPALRGWLVDTGVKPVAGALRQVGEDQCAICDVAATHGFVLGFYSARRSTASGARTDLLVGVLRFADSGAAAAAATEIVAKTLPLDPQFPMRPIQIAAHPDAKAYAMDFPNNPGGKVTAVKIVHSRTGYTCCTSGRTPRMPMRRPRWCRAPWIGKSR